MAIYTVTALDDQTYDGGDLAAETADGGSLSLREALALANGNGATPDTITFGAGLQLFLTNGQLEITTDDITIDGDIDNNGTPDVTISADSALGADDATSRVFLIDDSTAGTISAALNGLVIRDGNSFVDDMSLTVDDNAGGIWVGQADALILTNSTVSDNAGLTGGGIGLYDDAIALLDNVNVANNFSGTGGGISSFGFNTTISLTNSTVSGNYAFSQGGGIYGSAGADITLTGSTVSGNRTGDFALGLFAANGGGISAKFSASITLVDSTVVNNYSLLGGGIFGQNGITIALTNSTVSGNDAYYEGGGIFISGSGGFGADQASTLSLTNSTISGNRSETGGGGGGIASIGVSLGGNNTITLVNSILAGNAAQDPSRNDLVDFGATDLVLDGGNIVGDTFTLDGGSPQSGIALTDIFAIVGNDPNTGVLSGLLADNGGPVQTIALDPNANNPAIDSGDPDLLDETLTGTDLNGDGDEADVITTDARGLPRTALAAPDLGAFEVQAITEFTVTTLDDEDYDGGDVLDEMADGGGLSLREALALANADPDANTINFDASLAGTLTLTNGELTITSDGITIDGDADITISGNNASRVFRIDDDSAATVSATLNGLVIRDGQAITGGGIFIGENDALDLTNATLSGNSADLLGGGLFNGGTATLTNTTVSGNSADFAGGGLYNNGGTVALTNTTLSGNSADFGGGILNFNGTATLTSATLSGNSADFGGGLHNSFGTATLTNSIIAGNDAGTSGDEIQQGGTLNLAGGNIVGDTFSVDGVDQQTDIALTDIFAEVDANPFTNVQSGVLADNVGPVATIALAPDLANPAIDSGTGALPADTQDLDGDGDAAELLPVDARGLSRDVDFDGNPPTPDLGAFEQQNGADLVVTTLDDELDSFDPDATLADFGGAGDLSLREALALTQQDPTSIDSITFDASLVGGFTPGVDDGTLVLAQGELAIFGNVRIDGDLIGSAAPDITIDGAGASSVFHIYSGTVTLNGLAITGGSSSYGGGVAIGSAFLGTTATVTISDSTITQNFADYGGGVSVDPGSELALVDCHVSSNQAGYSGGGIANAGTLTITDCTVWGNEADLAGFGYSGGGLYNLGSATVIRTTIAGNDGGYAGGGIYNTDELTLVNSTLSGNFAEYGGGIANVPGCGCGSSTATLINATLHANIALVAGGGIYSYGGTLNVLDSTLTGNHGLVGGGVSSNDVAATLTNSIVAGNRQGGNVVSDITVLGSVTYSGVNLFSQPGAGDAEDIVETDLASIFAGLVTIDPDSVPNNGDEFQAGGRGGNGGPVETVLILQGGAAHNAGDNGALPDDPHDLDSDTLTNETLPIDGRGFLRIRSLTVDIGALELQNTAPVLIPVADQLSPINAFWDFQLPAGTFTDLDNDTLTFTARLGNGDPLPYWLAFDAATQTFTGTPPRNFVGSIELEVTASDGTDSTSDLFNLTVPAGNPSPQNLTPNPDIYNAGNAGEVINALAGNDTVTGGLGNDFINGNDGNDTIDGGGGANVLHGDGGNDYVASTGNLNEGWGDDGADQLFFVGDQNQLYGGAGNDWHGVGGTNNALAANGGDDWLGATGNFNTLNGQDGNDFLTAVGIGNVLHGETGNDWLGVSGDLSQLFGGAGNDWLGATGDNNTLDGGAGNDTLVAATAAHQGDVFNYRPGYAQDEVIGFARHGGGGTDVVSIQGFGVTTFAQLQGLMTQSGADTVITFNTADILTIRNVLPAEWQVTDFQLA